MYSNSCCSCSFEPEIIKIGQSSHKMYSNNILNFQESTTIVLQVMDCSATRTPSLSITGRHLRPTGGPVVGVLPLCRDAVGVFYCPSRQGKYHALSGLYPSTCSAWVALTGVRDSGRHSSRGHGDTQSAPPR